MREYRVMVGDRTFNIYKTKDEAIEMAKIVFDTGYNNVWISYKNGKQVPNTPEFKR